MENRKLLGFIYGIGALLIIIGAVMSIFWDMRFGRILIICTLVFVSTFQGRVIDKLYKQLKDKE